MGNKIIKQTDVKQNKKIYDSYYKDGVIDAWDDKDKSYNFYHLLKIIDISGEKIQGKSILDVGCGSGDFVPVLKKYKIEKYLGLDIYKPAIDLAKIKYPHDSFIKADLLKYKINKPYDFIFCSGALSIKFKSLDNYDFIYSMIKKMYDNCSIGVALNFLSDEDEDKDSHLFYYSVERVVQIAKKISEGKKIYLSKTPIPSEGRLDNIQYHLYLVKTS